MAYSYIERRRIHRQAMAKVGLKTKMSRDDFVQSCVDGMLSSGDMMNEDDAMAACETAADDEGFY